MKAGVFAVAAALASGVSAGAHAHRHAHEALHLERGLLLTSGSVPESTCSCTTVWVTETGAPTLIGVAPKPSTSTTSSKSSSTSTSTSSSSTSTSTSTTPPPPPPTTSTSAAPVATEVAPAVAAAPATTQAPAPAPAKASPAAQAPSSESSNSGSFSGTLGSSGDQWAVTYTPYNADNGNCLSAGQVFIDIGLIKLKGFSAVRTYSTDCNTLENVGSAAAVAGLKMLVGVYIDHSGVSAAQQQVSAIVSWARWDLVELVTIGNEAIFNGFVSASDLAGFISSSRSALRSAGYNGPVTATEPLNIWQESTGALCNAVDVVAANLHPFFNADITADQAGSFVKSQLDIVDGLCAGKGGVNLETGWPWKGQCNGQACPSPGNQQTAINSIKNAVGGKSVLFSFYNDLWKPLGAFECEQSWGMISLFPSL